MTDPQNAVVLAPAVDATGGDRPLLESQPEPLPPLPLPAEAEFYQDYAWTLNAYPTIAEVVEHLRSEIGRMDSVPQGWQLTEVSINIFLFACALGNAVEDHLMGKGYDFSPIAALRPARPAVRVAERVGRIWRRVRESRLGWLTDWRDRWESAVNEYTEALVLAGPHDEQRLRHCGRRLQSRLTAMFPATLLHNGLRNPAFFHVRDLTHVDILTLGRKLVARCPTRQTPILIVGVRTAGSYFAPLLRAYLKNEGYESTEVVTMRPSNALTLRERTRIARAARRHALGVIIDEAIFTGGTLLKVAEILGTAGFPPDHIVALFPVHPSAPEWKSAPEFLPLSTLGLVPLEPEEWHKNHLLQPAAVHSLLSEYFRARGYVSATMTSSKKAEALNMQLAAVSEEKAHTRLKRIYEVRLEDGAGRTETRFVLAKSVGWGWLAYRAFITGQRLSAHVPPVLGLRNGILFSEWRLPDQHGQPLSRDLVVSTLASYAAARVRSLAMGTDPSAHLNRDNQDEGHEALASLLSRAYGWKPAAFLKRPRIREDLLRHPRPRPTLIDGKMRRQEWINGTSSLTKTDFEHHGLGKKELNVVDPCYDLADAILHFELSAHEERALIARYTEETGDTIAGDRLLLNKLLAATRLRSLAVLNLLEDARLSGRAQEFNTWYNTARDFSIVHTMRFCAGLCNRPETPRWRSPLIVMDIDGVLDRQVFDFPATSAAGVQAVSLLHAHDVAIAVDTARSVPQVKEYCRAYGFVGGVAEYGSWIWDAVTERERVLISPESLGQLHVLRDALREIPGVFVDEGYRYSLRAYTHHRGGTAALPVLQIQNLMSRLNMNRLRFRQTDLDTAILAKEVDKGAGLTVLMTWVGGRDFETIAIGDSEPDLSMFAVATRSFAPSNISCRRVAKSLGCRIVDRPYQPGLLKIVRAMLHPDGRQCKRCRTCAGLPAEHADLMLRLLTVADQGQVTRLLDAALDPMAVRAFEL
jgi:hydroxymethylpyrimidine pyrophosphatase-like HAD family hydrolase/orotate phosphoribosyltransferase